MRAHMQAGKQAGMHAYRHLSSVIAGQLSDSWLKRREGETGRQAEL